MLIDRRLCSLRPLPTLFGCELPRISRDDLRLALVGLNLASRTKPLPHELGLRTAELPTVASPDKYGEHLSGIGLVEIQKPRLALRRQATNSSVSTPTVRPPIATHSPKLRLFGVAINSQ